MAFHYVLAVIPRNPISPRSMPPIAEWLMEQRTMTLTIRSDEIAYGPMRPSTEAIASREPRPFGG